MFLLDRQRIETIVEHSSQIRVVGNLDPKHYKAHIFAQAIKNSIPFHRSGDFVHRRRSYSGFVARFEQRKPHDCVGKRCSVRQYYSSVGDHVHCSWYISA